MMCREQAATTPKTSAEIKMSFFSRSSGRENRFLCSCRVCTGLHRRSVHTEHIKGMVGMIESRLDLDLDLGLERRI